MTPVVEPCYENVSQRESHSPIVSNMPTSVPTTPAPNAPICMDSGNADHPEGEGAEPGEDESAEYQMRKVVLLISHHHNPRQDKHSWKGGRGLAGTATGECLAQKHRHSVHSPQKLEKLEPHGWSRHQSVQGHACERCSVPLKKHSAKASSFLYELDSDLIILLSIRLVLLAVSSQHALQGLLAQAHEKIPFAYLQVHYCPLYG